jgi:RNA polymerase sporulation-specific sigma factor
MKLGGWIASLVRRLWKRLLPRREGSYYINGADVLPQPLDAETEAETLRRLEEEGNEEARSALIEHNLRLVVYIAKKFEGSGVGLEDLISIGTLGLIKAVETFRSDRNIKLATYASRCIENEILMYLRKKSTRQGEISIDEPLNVDWDGNELLLSDILSDEGEDGDVGAALRRREERLVIRRAVASLSERERVLIEMRFGMNGHREMTQKEVADEMGISQSYISRLEKKVIVRLREMIGDRI